MGTRRLLNKDAEELYDMFTEGKSRVQVVGGEFASANLPAVRL
jgi:hypothetical protein